LPSDWELNSEGDGFTIRPILAGCDFFGILEELELGEVRDGGELLKLLPNFGSVVGGW
jgi:hypothetical protein